MEIQKGILFNNRYRLLKEKGRGTFGEVWLAKDMQLDLDVAVKIYVALDDRGIDDFKSEYKTAYKLNHPNLLHAYHFDICDRRPFLVMPYCPDSAVSLIGNCAIETVWRFVRDVASGLAYLHDMDIVHHDIKPDNVMVTEDGQFVITDFGISVKMRSTLRRNSSRSSQQKSSGGSLPYMAPEMFTSTPESIKATDIWALGVTLYEIVAGELPFFGQGGVMLLNGASLPALSNDCPAELRNLINACLSKETWNRPSAKDLMTYADGVINGRNPSAPWSVRSSQEKSKDRAKTVSRRDIPVQESTVKINFKETEPIRKDMDNASSRSGKASSSSRKKIKITAGVIVSAFFIALLVFFLGGRISVSGKTLVSSGGEEVEYMVYCNRDYYTIENLPTWAKVVDKTYKGFKIAFAEDESRSSRECSFSVSTYGDAKKITITQKPIATYLKVAGKREKLTVAFTPTGGTRTISVKTDGENYEVNAVPSWCSIQQNAKSIVLSCSENTSKANRTGIFSVTVDDKSVLVTVNQSWKSATYLKVNDEDSLVTTSLPRKMSQHTFNVSTDADAYTVSDLPSWCTVASRNSSSFAISCSENTSDTAREGIFFVMADGKSVSVRIVQSGKEASYLWVNGQNTELESQYSSSASTCTYSVSTDGNSYEIKLLPHWCHVKEKYLRSFVIAYDDNFGASREGVFEVVSGLKKVKVRVQQSSQTGKASIKHVSVDLNAYQNSTYGILIHAKLIVNGMKGKECSLSAYFYKENGIKLNDINSNYCASDGQVSVRKSFTPSYDASQYSDFTLFIPNEELHLTRNVNHNLYFYLTVWDNSVSPSKAIGLSSKTSFNIKLN